MHELIITRNNHLVDPMLHIWGWQVPVYLFLGGLVAGMMIISGYFILTGRAKDKNCSCHFIPLIGLVAIKSRYVCVYFWIWNINYMFGVCMQHFNGHRQCPGDHGFYCLYIRY